jgi:hypothetical protein
VSPNGVSEDRVRTIVNEMVTAKFDELYALLYKIKGACIAFTGIAGVFGIVLTLLEIYRIVHEPSMVRSFLN